MEVIHELPEALDEMHKYIAAQVSSVRKLRRDLYNVRRQVRAANFNIGDFVLQGAARLQRKNKNDSQVDQVSLSLSGAVRFPL